MGQKSSDDIVIGVRVELEKARRQLKALSGRVSASGKKITASAKSVAKAQHLIEKKQLKLNKAMGKTPFAGWAMSLMFFGMALKRTFDMIWKSSTKTFNDVMHSVEGVVTNFDILDGSIKNLGFNAGQALEPIVQYITPIVDLIGEWVLLHPKLFAGFTVLLGVAGTLFTLLGMGALAFNGIVDALAKIGASGAMTSIGDAIAGISGTTFGVIIAALAALYFAFKTNLGNIREFFSETFGGIWETVKNVFGDIKEVFKGLMMFLEGVFTGDFNLVWNGLVKMVLNAVSAIIKIMWGLSNVIGNVARFIFNLIKDIVFNAVEVIIGAVKAVANFVDGIFGTNFSKGSTAALAMLKNLQEDITLTYTSSDNIAKADEAIEKITNLIEVYVTLDGDQVAEKVVTKVVEKVGSAA